MDDNKIICDEKTCEECVVKIANDLEEPPNVFLSRMSLLIKDINTILETPNKFEGDIYRVKIKDKETWIGKLKMVRSSSKKDIVTFYINIDKTIEHIIHKGQTKNVTKAIEHYQQMIQELPKECKIIQLKSSFSPEYNAPESYKVIEEILKIQKKPSKTYYFDEEGEIIQRAEIEELMSEYLDKAMNRVFDKINARLDKLESIIINNDSKLSLKEFKLTNNLLDKISCGIKGHKDCEQKLWTDMHELSNKLGSIVLNNTAILKEIKTLHEDIYKVKNDCDNRISTMAGSIQTVSSNGLNSVEKICKHITKECERIESGIIARRDSPYLKEPEYDIPIAPPRVPTTKKSIWGGSIERAQQIARQRAGEDNG